MTHVRPGALLVAAGMLLLAVSSVRAQDAAHEAALLQRVAWLAGCWGMNDGAVHSTEIWMEPAGGVMLGMSRTVEGGEAEGEFLEISIDGQHLVYTAIPEGQAETAFISTEISDTLIEFENAEHDFPQRIIYRRYSPDSLVARIEGDDDGGGLRAYEYPMRRIPCPGTAVPPSGNGQLHLRPQVDEEHAGALHPSPRQRWTAP